MAAAEKEGKNWLPIHEQFCIAMGETCNLCGLLNQFAKVCHIAPKNTSQKIEKIALKIMKTLKFLTN